MKKLLTLVAAFAVALITGSAAAAAGDVININVHQDGTAISQDQRTLASDTVKIPSDAWLTLGKPGNGESSVTGNTGFNLNRQSKVALPGSVTARIHSEAGSNWAYWNKNDTPTVDPQYAYLTCWGSNRDRTCIIGWFKLENVPFDTYDVILYFQGGTSMASGGRGSITVEGSAPAGFDPIRVTSGNSAFTASHYYKPDENGVLSIDTGLSGSEADSNLSSDVITQASLWGQRAQSTAAYGVNAVKVESCSGTFEIHYWARTAAIAAVQIIDREQPLSEHTATVSANTEWSKIQWSPAVEDVATANLKLTVENGAVITLDGEFAYAGVEIVGGATFVASNGVYEDGCWEKPLLQSFKVPFSATDAISFGALKEGFNGAYSQTDDGIWLRAQNKEVISINIAGGDGGDAGGDSPAGNLVSGTGFYGIAPTVGDSWNNINRQWQDGGNQTIEIVGPNAYDGNSVIARPTMSLSATGKNTWQCGSISNPFLRGYLDDGGGVTVEVHGVPYTKYDVIVYATSDSYRILAPITINNTQYTFKDGVVKPGSDAWGEGQYATPEIGKNALRVNDCTGDTITINAVRVGDNRATLCGVQVINKGEVVIKQDFSATITESVKFSEIIWNEGAFAEGQLNDVTITVGDGEGEVEIEFDNPNMMLGKITVASSRPVKFTAATALSNVGQFIIDGCTGGITYAYPVSRLTTAAGGVTYAADTGSDNAPTPINFSVQEGSMTLKDATFYLGTTYSAVTSTVEMVDAEVYANGDMGFGIGQAGFTLWGSTKLTSEKVVLSQGGANRKAELTLNDSAEIVVTGESIVDSNQSSIMFGHYAGPSIFTMNEESKFTAEKAQVLVGKTSGDQTININGGTFTAKGIKTSGSATGTNALNLNGGELKLGEYGITSYGSTTIPVTVGGNAKITSTAAMQITQPITVGEGITLTLDATAGDILLMGDVVNDGVIKVIGGAVTVMSNANDGQLVTEGEGQIIYGHIVGINELGKFAIPEGKKATDIKLYDSAGELIEITDSDDTYVYYDWAITGGVCWWDYEFEGNLDNAGNSGHGAMTKWGVDPVYYTKDDGSQSLGIHARPAINLNKWPTTATFVMYSKMVNSTKMFQLGFGSATSGTGKTIFLATEDSLNTVSLNYGEGQNKSTKLCTMTVPNAQATEHLYAFVLKEDDTQTIIDIYLDGELLQTYPFGSKIALGGGFQIGSPHGNMNVGYANCNSADDTATLDWLRVYDVELSKEALEAYAVKYPYVSPNGSFQREVTGDETWVSAGAWTNEGTSESASQPAAGSTAKLTVSGETTLDVNLAEDVVYEAIQINGGDLTIALAKSGETGKVRSAGRVTVNANVTFGFDAFSMEGAPVTVKAGKQVTFDLSMLNMSELFESKSYDLTGYLTLEDGASIDIAVPTELHGRTIKAAIDEATHRYVVNIEAPDQPFVYEDGVWKWGEQVLTDVELTANPKVTRCIKSDYTAALGAYNYTVEEGVTLKQTDASTTGVITVNAGGTFDINGVIDTALKVVLNGGSLVNTGTAVPVTKRQYVSISQTAASFVGGSNELAYVSNQYAANTLDLGDATLTKKDGNTFTLRSTTITSGTLAVTEGTLVFENCTIAGGATVTLEVAAGATVNIKGTFTKNENGVLNLTGEGTVICDGVLPAFDSVEGWTGTVWIKNKAIAGNDFGNVNNYGNENSIVKFTAVTGWMNNGTQPGPTVELEDGDTTDALTINDGSSSAPITFTKLIGTGTLTTSGSSSQKFYVADAAGFTGLITMATKKGILLGATEGTIIDNQIVIADGATIGCMLEAANIAFGKTVTIKGAMGYPIAFGLTAEPTLPTRVKLVDETGKETSAKLVYDSESEYGGMISIASGSGVLIMLK